MCFFTHINTIKILDKTLGKLSCEAHLGTHGALVHVEIKLTDEALQHQSRKIYCHIYNLIFLVPWGQIVWQCAQDCQCFTCVPPDVSVYPSLFCTETSINSLLFNQNDYVFNQLLLCNNNTFEHLYHSQQYYLEKETEQSKV